MSKKNIFYAQSGGVTSVINTTASAVIATAQRHKRQVQKVLIGKNGILGALREELFDASSLSPSGLKKLCHIPGGAFGSCRYKLQDPKKQAKQFKRIIEVCAAHDIEFFLYNGGGDSQDTTNKLADYARTQNYPLCCVGIPKTIDNDLPLTDNSPGFGSVAKYVATSVREASLDIASMCETSTKVFILEVMGRHTGWIAASSCLAARQTGDAPHVILLPERPFDAKRFLTAVKRQVKQGGYCIVVASEGLRDQQGQLLSENHSRDAFGHAQLGGLAPLLAQLIQDELGYKYHWSVADYLQRAARHIASATDLEQAYAVGEAALELALNGKNAVMPIICRLPGKKYRWEIAHAPLADIANIEKPLPPKFINSDGFSITEQGRAYLAPLILGEAPPPFDKGLPDYQNPTLKLVTKKLPAWREPAQNKN